MWKAAVGVVGGNPAYTYSWSPHGGTTDTAFVSSVGTYTVIIKDKNGCSTSTTANITCPIIIPTGDSACCGDGGL